MTDQTSELRNPYATPETTDSLGEAESKRVYGGIGRLAYFGFTLLAAIVYNVLLIGLGAVIGPQIGVLVIPMLIAYFGVLMWIVALRMKNTGYSMWWSLGMLVPILNIVVALRCIACPEGYAHHKTIDTAGKVIVGIFFLLLALAIVGLFLGS